jgi:hypothetical protein
MEVTHFLRFFPSFLDDVLGFGPGFDVPVIAGLTPRRSAAAAGATETALRRNRGGFQEPCFVGRFVIRVRGHFCFEGGDVLSVFGGRSFGVFL